MVEVHEHSAYELLQPPPCALEHDRAKGDRSYHSPHPMPYWFAFLEPPHGTPYCESDFADFNDVLFPSNDGIEVYREYLTFYNSQQPHRKLGMETPVAFEAGFSTFQKKIR